MRGNVINKIALREVQDCLDNLPAAKKKKLETIHSQRKSTIPNEKTSNKKRQQIRKRSIRKEPNKKTSKTKRIKSEIDQ